MFKSNKPSTPSTNRPTTRKQAAPSIISSDLHILGNLISDGTLDIDGQIEGNIKASHITIRENGKITGDVYADTIHVYGSIQGIIKAKDVHLFASCRVEGTIMHELLSIEDGAFVDGKFKRTDRLAVETSREQQAALADASDEEDTDPALLENIRLISGSAD